MWDVFIAPIIGVVVTLIAGKLYYKHEITWVEMTLSVSIAAIISVGVYMLLVFASLQETEVWNGKVTSKYRDEVSCEHSYEICSGSGEKRSCTTYYEHDYDYDWVIATTVGNLKVRRIDDQGRKEPSRFTYTKIGEPASIEHYYTDYVKGNADSIFHVDPQVYNHWKEDLFLYPTVYDYYRYDRVLVHDTKYLGLADQIKFYLNEELKTMGASHQVNLIVIITDRPTSFAAAQKFAWSGGRKNDVILFYGVRDNKIVWFDSTSFFDGFGNNAMHSMLRQEAVQKEMNLDRVKESVQIIKQSFVRNPMESKKYMLLSYDAPWWVILLSTMISIFCSVGLSALMGNYELTKRGFVRNRSWR